MTARDLTAAGLVAALGGLAGRPAIRAALKARADQLAARIAERSGSESVTVEEMAGSMRVLARGAGLFAREHGSAGSPPDPLLEPAIAELRR